MGCANIAIRSVIPTIKESDHYELVAVASRSAEKASQVAETFSCDAITGYENLLKIKEIDAIYMPLPTGLHEEWVMRTIDSGKHILCEKSLAMNYESATRMVDHARNHNVLLMENFMFLYHSQHQYVKAILDSGDLGSIRCFRSSFGFPPLGKSNFRYNQAAGGGSLLDAAAYTIRASQLILGNDLTVEAATLNYEDEEVDIFGGAFLKSKNGSFAEVAFGFDNYYQCNYEIWGSKGKLTLHKAFTPKPTEKPRITIDKQNNRKEFELAADDHFRNILIHFKEELEKNNYDSKYNEILIQSRLLSELKNKS